MFVNNGGGGSNALKFGLLGGGLGLLGSMFTLNPFDTLPMMLLGGGAGAFMGMMTPNYNQMMSTYDPRMLGYQNMGNYGGMNMPPYLFGDQAPQQQRGGGWGKFALGAGAGVLGALALGSFMNPFGMGGFGFGMPMMGMNPFGMMYGTGGMGMFGQSLGLGPFDWGVGVFR